MRYPPHHNTAPSTGHSSMSYTVPGSRHWYSQRGEVRVSDETARHYHTKRAQSSLFPIFGWA
ncbi:hypothetical protein E2C01_077777 [Portunus trituberculatus]|uniref:Uncharacterized protein n=1 Tax=Portunus trituberculatus TaxID=210409 RepID=A0A5B7IN74_PORTR|nr:hypothetical protein [Portunus trituberculatus]